MSTPSLLTGKWLYRAILQQAKQLPDTHVTDHYLHLIRSDFRKPLPLDRSRAYDRTVQAQKLLRRLMAANDGHLHAIERVLDQAYQRKGKGSHTLLEPFLSSSRQTNLFNSPSLRSLLTSPLSHTSRNPTLKQLDTPPTLPPRAFPHSEEARLLGPLIPQRVKAIRKRYWNSQTGKIKKPLSVLVVQESEQEGEEERMKREDLLKKVGLVGLGEELEKVGRERLQRLERLTCVPPGERPRRSRRLRGVSSALTSREEDGSSTWTSSTGSQLSSTAKEKDEGGAGAKTSNPKKASSTRTMTTTIPNLSLPKWSTPKVLRPRFMRRRYEALLEDAPIVTVEGKAVGTKAGGDAKKDGDKNKEKEKKTSDGPAGQERQVWVKVRLSEFAKSGNGRMGKVGEEDAWWMDR
ncbi:hypothetical protein MVLG_00750 [Microbotryum lychnidis-dioicae p1A1 Lamole]|uniref:LYR motif-containing protein Cup1-like N-terminal domain-containing protein n=2 Tax=Microbotryum lychnidis-dioicae (strain p1A1 Lamole / MvSl-1064) TaxID=683840 RepID=U5H008_USTV1|nr:hypothetical protein MVLG_00750 [Microbotryum lychnidis-dioicae p1A1 Lamole]|eukprot:KDE09030.1 hypothetical protein MVLG_00750 [Microbotryum lychnidis-dioicae p1A1 Lamole]